MMLVIALLGILAVAATLLLGAGVVQVGIAFRPEHMALVQGFGIGLVVTAAAQGLRSALAASRSAPPEPKLFEAHGSTCPTCRRPLLPGTHQCPFCKPVVPTESPLGATVQGDYKPLEQAVPMAGLAAAAKQSRDAGARGYLHIFTGANKGSSVLLGNTAVAIGRAVENTLILSDDGVSQRHAEVRMVGNHYYVRDVGSKNGTFVNDQRVSERRLTSGDVVAVGETKMLFQVT